MIIGLGGYATSGKDAVADLLCENHRYRKTYMSKPLEAALLALDPLVEAGDAYPVRYSLVHRLEGYDASKRHPEVRRLLQNLGTEVGRAMLGENVWVDLAFAEVARLHDGSHVAITGIRFRNELDAVRARGGLAVWVDRGLEPVNGHASDNTLGPLDFDVILKNDGTLDDLERRVATFVEWMARAEDARRWNRAA